MPLHTGIGLDLDCIIGGEEGACFRIVSARIGDPWPDQIYITYNENFNDTTCSVPGNWTFLYQFIPFDSVTPQAPVSATVDSWLVENTLEGKDGASPDDPITLSYTPGTCAKDGDPTCALEAVTNRIVTNRILGPTSLEIGNFANNTIVVDYPVDITIAGSAGTWSAESDSGPLTINTVSLVDGNVHLVLSADVAENDFIFVTHEPSTTANGAQGADGRYSYKYTGREAVNNVDSTAPTVPQNLVATATGPTTINLVWDPSTDTGSGMKEYVVYRASIEIARVPHPTTTYDDSGLSPETAYTYTVSAVDNNDIQSAQSLPDNATTWQPAPNVTAAEVGSVANNIIVVTFDREVVATDYAAGWSFTEDAVGVTISSANKTLATEVQFTLSADITGGTTVAYNYNSASGNYENTDGVDMGNQSGSVTNNAPLPQPAPLVVSAEVGNVADNIIVVTFDREVVSTNYQNGWSFTEDLSPVTISSANKTLATEVQFTLSADISDGTTVAYDYQKTSGDYENTDGVDMENQSGSVTNNVSPPVTGPDFVAYAADTNGIMRTLETGSGAITFNRSTTATVVTGPDNRVKNCKANEIRFQGARRGENLAVDLVTETYVETIVVGDEYQLTIAGDNGATAVCSGAFTGTLTADGTNRISWPNGTPKTATTTSLTITVTGTLTEKMLENVSGDIDQNPSEYIPAGEADGTVFSYAGGVRYYNYRKGNTVDGAGVVTETKGADLPAGSIKALLEQATTNRSRNSENFVAPTWSKSNCTVDSDVAIAPDGRQTADRLNVTPGTNVQTKVFWNLSTSSGPQTHSVWVKDDGAGYACVYLFVSATNNYTVTYDLSTGAVTDENIGASTTETRNNATDYGNGWWLFEIVGNFGSIGALYQQVSASSTPTPGFSAGQPVNSPVEGEDIFIWGAQNEQIKNSTSYIPTGDFSGGVNRTADDASPIFDIANFNQLSGTRVARVKFNGLASGDETLVEGVNGELLNMLTMQDGTMKSTDGTGTSVSPSMGGDASKEFYVAVNYVNGQPLEVGFRNITDAGTWQWAAAPVTYDGAFVTDNNIHVGFGQNVVLEISDLHGYLSAIGKAQIEATY